ncbi:hypothetical protein ACLOJK_039453 [Asimina triloba]
MTQAENPSLLPTVQVQIIPSVRCCKIICPASVAGDVNNPVNFSVIEIGIETFSCSAAWKQSLWFPLEESDCESNVVTYTAVIQGMFEKGRVDEALTNGCGRECHKRLVLQLAGGVFAKDEWFGKLEAVCGPVLDSDVYSVLGAGLCRQGYLVEAASIVGTMAERGMKARAPYVDGVVQELKAAGENELVFQLMDIGG